MMTKWEKEWKSLELPYGKDRKKLLYYFAEFLLWISNNNLQKFYFTLMNIGKFLHSFSYEV